MVAVTFCREATSTWMTRIATQIQTREWACLSQSILLVCPSPSFQLILPSLFVSARKQITQNAFQTTRFFCSWQVARVNFPLFLLYLLRNICGIEGTCCASFVEKKSKEYLQLYMLIFFLQRNMWNCWVKFHGIFPICEVYFIGWENLDWIRFKSILICIHTSKKQEILETKICKLFWIFHKQRT